MEIAIDKKHQYNLSSIHIEALVKNETNPVMKMATIAAVLKKDFPHIYWVGFYMVENSHSLLVGPYQGTPACIRIAFGKGVCGRVAVNKEVIIIDDVTALEEGEEHITCDPASKSEIVLPVLGRYGKLIAVLDLDSDQYGAFDEVDTAFLTGILKVFRD